MKDQIQTLIQEHKERLYELSLFLNDISAIKNKNVSTVITGASKLEQVQHNMKAMDLVSKIDAELLKKLNSL